MGNDVRTGSCFNVSADKTMLAVNLSGGIVATIRPSGNEDNPDWWVVGINLVVFIGGERQSLHILTRMFTKRHEADDFVNQYLLNVYNSKCELPNDETL